MKLVSHYTIEDLCSVVELAVHEIASHHDSLRWQLDKSGINFNFVVFDGDVKIGELQVFQRGPNVNIRPIQPRGNPIESHKEDLFDEAFSNDDAVLNRYKKLDVGIWKESDQYQNGDVLFHDICLFILGRWQKELIQNQDLLDWAWHTKPILELRSEDQLAALDDCEPTISADNRHQLQTCLIDHFNRDDILGLCSYIGFNFDLLPQAGLVAQVNELINSLGRDKKLDALISKMGGLRPECKDCLPNLSSQE
jgi:hypothetical protein